MNELTDTMQAIQARTGWTDETIFLFALRFLAERDMTDMFEQHLEKLANEEDAEVADETSFDD